MAIQTARLLPLWCFLMRIFGGSGTAAHRVVAPEVTGPRLANLRQPPLFCVWVQSPIQYFSIVFISKMTSPSYGDWNLDELKAELRKRKARRYGRKHELVQRWVFQRTFSGLEIPWAITGLLTSDGFDKGKSNRKQPDMAYIYNIGISGVIKNISWTKVHNYRIFWRLWQVGPGHLQLGFCNSHFDCLIQSFSVLCSLCNRVEYYQS